MKINTKIWGQVGPVLMASWLAIFGGPKVGRPGEAGARDGNENADTIVEVGAWHGDLGAWQAGGVGAWNLDAPEAGTAVLFTCPIGLSMLGGNGGMNGAQESANVVVRWQQQLAGSGQNFSRIHFFTPVGLGEGLAVVDNVVLGIGGPEGAGTSWVTGSWLHVGETGQEDEIVLGEGDVEMDSDGGFDVAEGLDLRVEWLQSGPESPAVIRVRQANSWPPSDTLFSFSPTALPKCVGITAHYTSSNVDAFSFAVQSAGPWTPDTGSVQLLHHALEGDSAVFLQFGRALNDPAEVAVSWNGVVGPGLVAVDSTAHRFFARAAELPLPAGYPVVIAVTSATSGASSVLDSAWVDWPTPLEAVEKGDLVCTEILADPTPSVGLPEREWTEWTNRSPRATRLTNLLYWDATSGVATLEAVPPWDGIVPAGESFVVAADTAGLRAILGTGGLLAYAPAAGALTDYGDHIGLLRIDGLTVDEVQYEGSWWNGAGGGIPLGRKFVDHCGGKSNWSAEMSPSPGAPPPMSATDSATPAVTQIIPFSMDRGVALFDVPLDPAFTPELAGDLPGWTAVDGDQHLAYTLQGLPASADSTKVILRGVKGCDGALADVVLELPFVATPESGELVIAEIQHAPLETVGPPGWIGLQWAELANISDHELDVTACRMGGTAAADAGHMIILQPGERLALPFTEDFSRRVDFLRLADGFGRGLDSVLYSACWHARADDEGNGRSLVRLDLEGPSQDARNWDTSKAPEGGSPGAADPAERPWNETSAIEILTCAVDAPVFTRIVLLLHPVSEAPAGWEPRDGSWTPTEDPAAWWTNRAWVVPFTELMAVPGCSSNATNEEGDMPLQVAEWRKKDTAAGTEAEAFIEVTGGMAGDSWVWSTVDAPDPEDWTSINPLGWHWGSDENWAVSECPNRMENGERRLLSQGSLPSLYGDRTLNWSRNDLAMPPLELEVDDGVYGPWEGTKWASGRSMERVGTTGAFWTPCRNPQGHSAGLPRAASTLDVDDSPCEGQWHDQVYTLSGRHTASQPSSVVFISVHDLHGRKIVGKETNEEGILSVAGETWNWNWDGMMNTGVGFGSLAPPGPYLITTGSCRTVVIVPPAAALGVN